MGVTRAGQGTGWDVEKDEAFFEAEKIDKLWGHLEHFETKKNLREKNIFLPGLREKNIFLLRLREKNIFFPRLREI